MSTGSWMNNDALFLQFGTQKANPDMGGIYRTTGTSRVAEVVIDLKSLTTSPVVQSINTLFPAGTNVLVEKIELVVEEASASGTSFSVGLGYLAESSVTYTSVTNRVETAGGGTPTVSTTYTSSLPNTTVISNTAFVNALINASTNTQGNVISMTVGSTSAGGYLGTTSTTTTHPNYITALAAGTYTAGIIRVRIFWRGIGTISQ